MKPDESVVLDACVLIPMPLVDTLLRLAEAPGLYRPRWSAELLSEMHRNLVAKIGLTERQAERRESVLREHFPEALVEGYEHLTELMRNNPKDRHVLAAAAHCQAGILVTFNLRDFPVIAARPLGVEVIGPSAFLRGIYDLAPAIVCGKLWDQAVAIDMTLAQLLRALRRNVPGFIGHLCEREAIRLE